MRRNTILTFLKEKSFIIVVALCLISAATMVTMYQTGKGNQELPPQVADAGESAQKTENITKNSADEKKTTQNTDTTKKKTTGSTNISNEAVTIQEAQDGPELEDQYAEAEEMTEAGTDSVIAEGFTGAEALTLALPVDGETILAFSMDHSIYFPTLSQYKYNPAAVIASEEGTPVLCAATGTVTEVGKCDEYGHYVSMDLGDGYEITYGQLEEITVAEGDVKSVGEQFAMVGYTTRAYTVEGDNLYLKLTKDEVPVDPMLYMTVVEEE